MAVSAILTRWARPVMYGHNHNPTMAGETSGTASRTGTSSALSTRSDDGMR